jgi:cobalt/nickel transport system permease protein
MGGVMAAVLVGPWTGALCVSVVLLVQALFMADGGVTALGTNIVLMALAGTFAGWVVFRGTRAVLPKNLASVPIAAAIGALLSVPIIAIAFTVLFVVGGTVPIETGDVLVTMVGWHVLIGIGEAVVTGLVVGAVVSARPDLVHGARGLLDASELEIRTAAT